MAYQRGSGFIGLQQYLNANQQAAQRMGGQLAGQIEAKGAEAKGAIDARQAQVAGQIAQGTPPTADTNTWGLEPDEIEAMRAAGMARGYTGPADMGNVDALNTQAGEAERMANLGSSDAGRAVLLRQGKTGPYTAGQSALDSFLAGRGGGARFEQAQKGFGGLRAYLGTAQQDTAAAAKAAQEQAGKGQAAYGAIPQPTYGPAPVRAAPGLPTNAPGRPYIEANKRVEEDNRL